MAGSQLRKFGKSLIVIVAMALFACTDSGTEAAGATDNKVYKWRMVTTWPKNYPGVGLACLLYTSPSPRDKRQSRMPSSA